MVEAFIKIEGSVWEKQNTAIDRDLKLLPVNPGDEIKIVRRESAKNIGHLMLLTFSMAHSDKVKSGSQILVGEFPIPGPK